MNNLFTSFEDFKVSFANDLKERLCEAGIKAELEERAVKKLNDSYAGLTVTPEGSNIGMNLCLDMFYEAIEKGRPYEEVLEKAMETIHESMNSAPALDIATLTDYGKLKETLVMQIVSAERNAEMLDGVPHKMMEDMAVVYRFMLKSDGSGTASILVTDQLLSSMGISPEQLEADAMEKAPENKPAKIQGMSEVMIEMMGIEQAEIMGIPMLNPADEQIFVASVDNKVHGAVVLAYPGFLEQAKKVVGGSYYILPSSIHECLLVPDNGKMGFRELSEMVRDVNATQVAPEDKLTDTVYHYDGNDGIFETGQKWLVRTNREEALA